MDPLCWVCEICAKKSRLPDRSTLSRPGTMRLWEIGDIVDVLEALGRPQISSVLRVRNMLQIVLGALVLIGVFVFWCDVTDSWNKVLKKTGKR
jgi:hypothetical protein